MRAHQHVGSIRITIDPVIDPGAVFGDGMPLIKVVSEGKIEGGTKMTITLTKLGKAALLMVAAVVLGSE